MMTLAEMGIGQIWGKGIKMLLSLIVDGVEGGVEVDHQQNEPHPPPGIQRSGDQSVDGVDVQGMTGSQAHATASTSHQQRLNLLLHKGFPPLRNHQYLHQHIINSLINSLNSFTNINRIWGYHLLDL